MAQEELTKDEKARVVGCDHYRRTKEIMAAHKRYKTLEIGEVYFIKSTNRHDKSFRYLSRSIGQAPSKYVVFHKDEDGFVFIKRIGANGKLGKTVECLQTQYSSPFFDVEPDPEFVEAILFENEGDYDPLKAEKALVKKKNQARRKNKKIEIAYKNYADAYKKIGEYKVGDKIWDAGTTYGSGIVEWEVTSVIKRKTDKTKNTGYSYNPRVTYGNTYQDQQHNAVCLDNYIQIDVKLVGDKPKERRWLNTTNSITFYDFVAKQGSTYYVSKPWSTDDL